MNAFTEVPLSKRDLDAFRKLIYELAGISLSEGKHVLVQSRLAKRLRHLGLDDYSQYLAMLKTCERGAPELERFINALTTNKTEFFREPHHFEFLRNEILPSIEENAEKGGERKVRIWCAASSTGEEPYTLAMSLDEHFRGKIGWDLRILASDIDTDVLRKASDGSYCSLAMDYLDPSYRKRYFTKSGENAVANDVLKKLITFRQINLNLTPWPINSSFDAIFCRNVMIYFDQETQKKLIDNLCNYLNPNGHLIIGHSESLLGFGDRLESLGNTIYRLKSGFSPARVSPAPQARPIPKAIRESSSFTTLNSSTPEKSSTVNPTRSDSALSRLATSSSKVSSSTRDELESLTRKHIIVGQYYASRNPCRIQTTLGSCIAVCLYDPSSKVGGMNHFMLPESKLDQMVCASYGVHAMELLINRMMKQGADRRSLRAKIFGGANVIVGSSDLWNVGKRNIDFIKEFLSREQVPVDAEYLGGEQTLQIQMVSHTFKVVVKLLDASFARKIADEQLQAASRLNQRVNEQSNKITLFDE